jgi:hypothetical protein
MLMNCIVVADGRSDACLTVQYVVVKSARSCGVRHAMAQDMGPAVYSAEEESPKGCAKIRVMTPKLPGHCILTTAKA